MDPKILIAIVIIIFVGDILFQAYQNKKRNDLFQKLSKLLIDKDYKTFDELIEAPETRKLFPTFYTAFLKLNEALLQNDAKKIDKAFDSFAMNMNKAQKEALYKKGFYYYLSIEDKTKTDRYYEQLKQLNVNDQHILDVTYDTYIKKGYAYLEETLQQIKDLDDRQKMPYYALLSDMYKNKGEEDKAKEYEKLVSEFTKKMMEGKEN